LTTSCGDTRKASVCQQKLQIGELLHHNVESADGIRGKENIRKATNPLLISTELCTQNGAVHFE
jgi:hypothetical protein